MTIDSPAIEWVRVVAEHLGELRDEVVFLGGATVGLLITDPATTAVRPTKDVDVIVEVGSYSKYATLQERLRQKGFSEDTSEGAPICRWVIAGIKVDVMPTHERILGFSNRWYTPAMKAAQHVQLTDSLAIRMVSPPFFMATKIEAFHGRGKGDYLFSHDIEDLFAVVDGRPKLIAEIAAADKALRLYLREQIEALLADYGFREALSGNLRSDAASQARLPTILFRLHCIHSKDEEQALLRTVLDHVIDARELPQVQQFRLAHKHRPSLLGDLVEQGFLVMNRGRYTLTIKGLRGCLPGQARDEIKRCNGIIDELKAMYRSDPERLWPTRELTERTGVRIADVARAVTFLSESPFFYGLNWNGGTGLVESFSLGPQALNAEHLALHGEFEE